MSAPCATCRHEVDHLIALDITINDLRAKARTHRAHRSLRGIRGLNVGEFLDYIDAARKATHRHLKHRENEHGDERRATIRDLAQHLTEHAERSAA